MVQQLKNRQNSMGIEHGGIDGMETTTDFYLNLFSVY